MYKLDSLPSCCHTGSACGAGGN